MPVRQPGAENIEIVWLKLWRPGETKEAKG